MDAAATLVPAKVRESVQEFNVGDTVRVNVTIREGDRTRVQAFQGIVIKGSYSRARPPSPGATFIVRRVSYGIGVERTFLLCSPLLDSLENLRRGRVAQGRLYYLRGLSGKRARIKEKRTVPGATVAGAPEGLEAAIEPDAGPNDGAVGEAGAGLEPDTGAAPEVESAVAGGTKEDRTTASPEAPGDGTDEPAGSPGGARPSGSTNA